MTRSIPPVSAPEPLIELVDTSSYRSWDIPPIQPPHSNAYATELNNARHRSGVDEAVLTGEATIAGHRVALIVSEFAFLGGTIGQAAAHRIQEAVRRATAQGLPIVASPASGGTRMQEGTPAFVTMISLARAVREHKDGGLLYAVYLRHPTTGGVMASWGSLGQLTFAEPGALLGFLGPKVYRALHGREFPPGVQVAENLHRKGLVDQVVTPSELRPVLAVLFGILEPPTAGTNERTRFAAQRHRKPGPTVDPWACVEATRRADRPGLTEFLQELATSTLPLIGTAAGERDPALHVGLARVGSSGCVVIGHDRRLEGDGHLVGPAGLRQAQRGIRLAGELRLPLLTVIDTSGAELSVEAEEGALAAEIARCIEALGSHRYGSVSVLLGQGTGGGALALLPADKVIAAEHAWLAPLPPEGASAIVHGHKYHAPSMARSQRISARELADLGIVQTVVREDSPEWLADLARAVEDALDGMRDARRPMARSKSAAR
jgi:acyl-CoA carboxylase subunit beta